MVQQLITWHDSLSQADAVELEGMQQRILLPLTSDPPGPPKDFTLEEFCAALASLTEAQLDEYLLAAGHGDPSRKPTRPTK